MLPLTSRSVPLLSFPSPSSPHFSFCFPYAVQTWCESVHAVTVKVRKTFLLEVVFSSSLSSPSLIFCPFLKIFLYFISDCFPIIHFLLVYPSLSALALFLPFSFSRSPSLILSFSLSHTLSLLRTTWTRNGRTEYN